MRIRSAPQLRWGYLRVGNLAVSYRLWGIGWGYLRVGNRVTPTPRLRVRFPMRVLSALQRRVRHLLVRPLQCFLLAPQLRGPRKVSNRMVADAVVDPTHHISWPPTSPDMVMRTIVHSVSFLAWGNAAATAVAYNSPPRLAISVPGRPLRCLPPLQLEVPDPIRAVEEVSHRRNCRTSKGHNFEPKSIN